MLWRKECRVTTKLDTVASSVSTDSILTDTSTIVQVAPGAELTTLACNISAVVTSGSSQLGALGKEGAGAGYHGTTTIRRAYHPNVGVV